MIGLPTRVTSRISSGAIAGFRRRLVEQAPDRDTHRRGHLPFAAGVHHHVRDAAHEVLSEPDLRIHRAGRGDDSPDESSHRCAAMVVEPTSTPPPVCLVPEARPDPDDVAPRRAPPR